MTRSTLLSGAAAFVLLAGCSGAKQATGGNMMANEAENLSVEDVPSDGLAAPADMPLDSESNGADGGNAM